MSNLLRLEKVHEESANGILREEYFELKTKIHDHLLDVMNLSVNEDLS